ncbi:hypothetical protein NG819_07930 [Pseudarthrobacter sp. Fe7]|nr:hypothetical protein NG819_07930 [Pseudarthrobacter sp. Fe7]
MAAGRNHAWSASALLVVFLSTLFVGIPAAHAAFKASAQSGFPVSALTLQSPVPSITASCAGGGSNGNGKKRLNIAVTSAGSVPRANAYVLIVTDPSGSNYSVNPATSGYSNQSPAPGIWTYYVQAQYQVPGTTNVWKSKTATPLTVSC